MKDSKLRFFMREDLKADEIKEVPGLDRFKDEAGAVIPFQIKVLGMQEVSDIRKAYKTKKMAMETKDGKKRPMIVGGEIAYVTEYDSEKATDHIIAEALIYPNLKDAELMQFYGCIDMVEMPRKIFKHVDDYKYVSGIVVDALGLSEKTDDEEIDEVKN